jgi:hypothetical protein
MGGQACVFYGAAEFSRDLDLLVLSDPASLHRLSAALEDLDAHNIAVPPLDPDLLDRGHAVHFRCRREDVAQLRIDVMGRLRGVEDFEKLWSRRTTIEVDGEPVDLLAIEDLVRAKKTQRDKDWPMIRRLVEQSYFSASSSHTPDQVEFWLRELRTPELLVRAAAEHRSAALASRRPAVAAALTSDVEGVEQALDAEEREERLRDREYWAPLKREIEALRRTRLRSDPPGA